MANFSMPFLPALLVWEIEPVKSSVDAGGLSILAGKETDWFNDPAGNEHKDNAPCALMTPPDAYFILSARVTVTFSSTFDAGVIQVRAQDDLWAKLCFEYSPLGRPMVVSVVTRGVSDDCNSAAIDGNAVYLRVAHTPQTLAFHYSLDGHFWHLVRYFSLGQGHVMRVGFSAQSPTGASCSATFSEIAYRAGTLADLRNGE